MKCCWLAAILGALLLGSVQAGSLHAETGYDAWLRYAPLEKAAAQKYETFPASVVVLGNSAVLRAAQEELLRGKRKRHCHRHLRAVCRQGSWTSSWHRTG